MKIKMNLTKISAVMIIFFTLTVFSKETVSQIDSSKDWNISINLQYYGTLSMGTVFFGNFKYLHYHMGYAHTILPDKDMNFHTFGGGIGGQYDMIKNERFDSIIFAGASLMFMSGNMYQMTYDGGSHCDFILIGPTIGYEFSVGRRNLKFNTGISLDVQFCVYSREDDEYGKPIYDEELGFFFWFTSPSLRIYAGIKF
ncbi:MAG TPA: hypothetical protein PLB16_04170 [bacterium]|jgi:hypothetical protein|nr:hypothetical protein [bacterium]MDX9806608.1 hypothetical protein [bacterium]HQN72586.1 hypothetical protein [bacterium]